MSTATRIPRAQAVDIANRFIATLREKIQQGRALTLAATRD